MKKKLIELLSKSVKDFGLTSKAIEELADMQAEGISDETSDEELQAKVDLLVPFAKLMQGEITRKTRKKIDVSEDLKDKENKPSGMEEILAQMKAMQDSLSALQNENAEFKKVKAKEERKALIEKTAEELGIASTVLKFIAIPDDADVVKTLTEYQQAQVDLGLKRKDPANATSTSESIIKEDAEAWANSLM